MEPNRLPKVMNILVFQDHFRKHVMAYVAPNQTTNTVAKISYQGYISIFGTPAKLLSDHGANFMSSITGEICKLLSMNKLQTMPDHLQTNGLVERSHQTIMQMIGKLGEDEKANWPGHLAEIVHVYNATWSTVSPHYLMFGCRPRLPVDFCFPTLRSAEVPKRGTSVWHVNEYIATVRDHLKTALSTAEAQRQRWYYDWKIGTIGLKPSNLILVKADASQGKRNIQGQIGGQASWGSMSDHDRHLLIQRKRQAWKFTLPTLQPTPPHCIRSCHSPICGCLPSTWWMYQPHPSQAYSWREWQQDNATRTQWSSG